MISLVRFSISVCIVSKRPFNRQDIHFRMVRNSNWLSIQEIA